MRSTRPADRTSLRTLVVAVMLTLILIGCRNPCIDCRVISDDGGGVDLPLPIGGPVIDAAGGGADTSSDADTPREPGESCDPSNVIDVNAVGVRHGRTTVVRVPSERFTRGSLRSAGCAGPSIHQVVLRYTMHHAGSLSVSTYHEGLFEPDLSAREQGAYGSELWITDRCPAGGIAEVRSFACAPAGLDDLVVVRHRALPGTSLYVVVNATPGSALLTLLETYDVRAAGSDCEVDSTSHACDDETTCALVRGRYRCAPDGAAVGTHCRSVEPRCDPGLACDVRAGDLRGGICREAIAAEEDCHAFADELQPHACPNGSCRFVDRGYRCVADGALGGQCRFTSPPCDGALSCVREADADSGRCLPGTLPSGAPCHPHLATGACPADEVCVETNRAQGQYRCLRVGSEGGECRIEAPYCDDGLSCDRAPREWVARCRRGSTTGTVLRSCSPFLPRCGPGLMCRNDPVSNGVLCDVAPTLGMVCNVGSCDRGLTCVPGTGDGMTPSTCRPWGAGFAECRVTVPHCDPGYECSERGFCLPPVAAGAACAIVDLGGVTCADGAVCNGRCRADGVDGGGCRMDPIGCDPGLVCTTWRDGDPKQFPGCQRPGRAGDACWGGVFCEAGTSCSLPRTTGARDVCAMDGALGARCRDAPGVPPCDPGMRCNEGSCTQTFPPGADCSAARDEMVCPEGTVCCGANGWRCRAPGAAVCPCSTAGAPCDVGLLCRTGYCFALDTAETYCRTPSVCARAGASGAACSPSNGTGCDPGLVCDQFCGVPRPPSPAYRVERINGATMIDVCGAPASELPEGFPFVLFGQRYDNVTFDDWLNEGRVLGVSSAFGAATIEPAFGFETPYGPGSRPPMTDFVCARISGIAPARTLIIEWRPHPLSWVFNSVMEHSPRLDGVAHYEVLLYEGSNVVEIRYGHATSVGESPARDLVLHPRIAYQGTYAFLPGVTEGTTVRFTPR